MKTGFVGDVEMHLPPGGYFMRGPDGKQIQFIAVGGKYGTYYDVAEHIKDPLGIMRGLIAARAVWEFGKAADELETHSGCKDCRLEAAIYRVALEIWRKWATRPPARLRRQRRGGKRRQPRRKAARTATC